MRNILTKENWLQIGREYAIKGPAALAKEFGVSKQRVAQVATRLRKLGVPIPLLRLRELAEVAEILKKEFEAKE